MRPLHNNQSSQQKEIRQPYLSTISSRPKINQTISKISNQYQLSTRGREMEQMIGKPPRNILLIRNTLNRISLYNWQKTIVPLIEKSWPSLMDPHSPDYKIYNKMKFLGMNCYGRCQYYLFFLTHGKSLLGRTFIGVSKYIPFPNLLDRITIWGIQYLNRYGDPLLHDAIAISGITVALFDEVFDRLDNEPSPLSPAKRAHLCKRVIREHTIPNGYKLTNSTRSALNLLGSFFKFGQIIARQRGTRYLDFLNGEMLRASDYYCDLEAKAFNRESDPTGTAFREGGTQATVRSFMFAVSPNLSETQKKMFEDLTTVIQMVDDWIDLEEDQNEYKNGGRPTPVLSGDWTLPVIQEFYKKTIYNFTKVLNESGIRGKKAVQLSHACIQDLYYEMLHAMDLGIAN